MSQSLFRRVIAALVFLSILFVSSCAGVASQVTRPVQVPQNVPPAEIADLVASSLGQLNYSIVEMNPSAGTVSAERRVPNDVWNRVTKIKVDIAPGGHVLMVEASSCPGCIPQATYDPEFMINEFNANFDFWLRFYGQKAYASQSGQPDSGSQRAVPKQTGPSSPPPPVIQPPAPPALRINGMEISPGVVAAGSAFDVIADYMVFDPVVQDRELPVQFSLAILQDGRVLYSPKAVEIKSPNKVSFKRIEHMNASKDRGRYTVRAILRYKDMTTERSAEFEIR
jgi:hypothetical protein